MGSLFLLNVELRALAIEFLLINRFPRLKRASFIGNSCNKGEPMERKRRSQHTRAPYAFIKSRHDEFGTAVIGRVPKVSRRVKYEWLYKLQSD